MNCRALLRSLAILTVAAATLQAHVLSRTTLDLVVGGPPGTFELRNGAGEVGCTTIVAIRKDDPNNAITVSPTAITYVTPDNPTPAQTFTTFTVTALNPGNVTIFVDWRIDSADTGPNCTSTSVSSPTVTVRVTPPSGPLPLSHTINTLIPPVLRAEGLRELVGDIVIRETGGTPTPLGQPVPTANFLVTLNTNITSRVLNDPFTEALLLIDDPASTNQLPCVTPQWNPNCPLIGVGPGGFNFGSPSSAANGGQAVRNVFQGRVNGPNSLLFAGIPITPPGTTSARIYRITNVRANASTLGVSSTLVPSQIVAFLSVTPAGATTPIFSSQTPVATVQSDPFDWAVVRNPSSTNSFQQCVAGNPNITASTQPSFALRFREGFATAFKVRTQATTPQDPGGVGAQNAPGQIYSSASGFFNPNFPAINGLNSAGLADHGTRLKALFNDVPAGIRLHVSTSSLGSGPSQARATTSESGPFTPLPPGPIPSIVEIPIVNGTGTAVWEVVSGNSQGIDTFDFGVWPSYTPNPATNLPGLGTATVNGSFAPISIPPGGPFSSLPSFTELTPRPRSAFAINVCATNLLFPFVTNQLGFDTGLSIANTSQDIFVPQGSFPVASEGPVDQLDLSVTTSGTSLREATSNWLTVNLDYASTPATAIYEVNSASLQPGSYQGMISISSPKASNRLNVPVRLTVVPPGPSFSSYGVVNAAGYQSAAVAPGEAIVIFGRFFGPAALATLRLNSDGLVDSTLSGTRVFFDGVPAPMIYAVNGQISAFVPFSVAGKKSTVMRVDYNGVQSLAVTLPVIDAIPGLFTVAQTGAGQGAILNQDGTVNSASNRAAINDVVVLFGTGAGQTNPGGTDGKPAVAPLPVLLLPVKAFVDGREAEVLYAGPAPSLAEGVLQVNARIPAGITSRPDVPIWITVGDKRSQPGVSLAVR